MQDFRARRGQLRRLSTGARLLYSTYLLFALIALSVAALLYQAGPTVDVESSGIYYAGGQVADEPRPDAELALRESAQGESTEASGPSLDLGGLMDPVAGDASTTSVALRAEGTRIEAPFNKKRLLEVTHGHLFMMPLVLLVISHLFLLTGVPRLLAGAAVGLATLSVVAHLAAPWLIRSVSTDWSLLLLVSGLGMVATLGGMSLISLVCMWWPRPASARNA